MTQHVEAGEGMRPGVVALPEDASAREARRSMRCLVRGRFEVMREAVSASSSIVSTTIEV